MNGINAQNCPTDKTVQKQNEIEQIVELIFKKQKDHALRIDVIF
jgi:hypothetical protein